MEKLNTENKYIWNKLSSFVEDVCNGRDESHGYNHMKKVAENSLEITHSDFKNHNNYEFILTHSIIVSWLHDVCDHKYDKDGILYKRVVNFLEEEFKNYSSLYIMNIIDRISYSKEVKAIKDGTINEWVNILGKDGMIIRDIVSDADKIEALGTTGFERCILYTKEIYFKMNNKEIPYEILKKNVTDHANEKLLKLKDEYIKTKKGKEIALPLHNELVNLLDKL